MLLDSANLLGITFPELIEILNLHTLEGPPRWEELGLAVFDLV